MNYRRTKVLVGMLAASLTLNALGIGLAAAWVARKGGPRYAMEKLGLVRTVKKHLPWQRDLIRQYRELPNTPGEVIFLGDSITQTVPWAEFYSDIRNRGIGGDTTDGVLQRLDEIVESHPKQVFLNIGTNDLNSGLSVAEILRNVEAIVSRIRDASPSTEVHLCSVIPINLDYERDTRLEWKFRAIGAYTDGLRRLADAAGSTSSTSARPSPTRGATSGPS